MLEFDSLQNEMEDSAIPAEPFAAEASSRYAKNDIVVGQPHYQGLLQLLNYSASWKESKSANL
jgi:hypothetical protein